MKKVKKISNWIRLERWWWKKSFHKGVKNGINSGKMKFYVFRNIKGGNIHNLV